MALKTEYRIYDIQLADHRDGKVVLGDGGFAFACIAGEPLRAPLHDPDSKAALDDDTVALVDGRAKFAVPHEIEDPRDSSEVVNSDKLDIYILGPDGHFAVAPNIDAAGIQEVFIDRGNLYQTMKIPFSIHQATAAAAKNVGFKTPDGAVFDHGYVQVTEEEATRTIDVGHEDDGNAFVAGASLASEGTVDAGAISGEIGDDDMITYTLSADTDSAEGFIFLNYRLAA